MTNLIENRIREIVKAKGLKMSDLANRCCVGQSNLVASIRSNPKLSTLQDIADALGIRVSDIVDPERVMNETGIAIVDGKTYVLSKPSYRVVQVPTYKDYGELREVVKNFIVKSIKKEEDSAICGIVESMEYFNLFYDANIQQFNLNLCYGEGQMWVEHFSVCEWGDIDKMDIQGLCQEVINDIEGVVLMKFGVIEEGKASITQKEVESILFKDEEQEVSR